MIIPNAFTRKAVAKIVILFGYGKEEGRILFKCLFRTIRLMKNEQRVKKNEQRAKNQEQSLKSKEQRTKNKEPRTKSQEPRTKSQEPRANI